MALRYRVLFLIFCLISLVSQGLGRLSPTSPPGSSKEIFECWSASFDLAKCSGELLRATQGGMLDLRIWPDCCQAVTNINSGCWPKIFPMNPFFSQMLQMYCPRLLFTPPQPTTPNFMGPSSVSSPVDAPTPSADGPIMDEQVMKEQLNNQAFHLV
ncbi:hypothetical protein QVD17_26327 [Tagetes erecta]|uniref:Prolamin-like domain-containing protein n=1 Tax=Tagetes erecta TaxID=13708 RepID=A0AAD8K8T2_TARER|nr:hypothetical protein QVD17_26327 [Tagetes erecta]